MIQWKFVPELKKQFYLKGKSKHAGNLVQDSVCKAYVFLSILLSG